VTLAVDVMCVDGIPFVVSLSRKIKFTTSEYIPRRSKPLLVKSLKKIINIYNHRGFNVVTALMDREFEPLRDEGPEVTLNTAAADEHVPGIERQMCTMKERARDIRSTLPFKCLPARMIIELVHFSTLWLNAFPPSSGVSDTFSPRTIMTGTSLDYIKHCQVPFGAYVETHEENSPTNTMYKRTRGAICLGPSANFQGSYKFMCLPTGKKIVRKQFTELPMPDSVIKRVKAITARDKRSGNMVFSARDGTPIGDDHDDDDEDVTTGVDNGKDDDTGEERSQNNPPGIPLENQNGQSSDEINDEEAELIPTPDFTADIPETDEGEIPGVGEDETPDGGGDPRSG
jgi:hypothetical protein